MAPGHGHLDAARTGRESADAEREPRLAVEPPGDAPDPRLRRNADYGLTRRAGGPSRCPKGLDGSDSPEESSWTPPVATRVATSGTPRGICDTGTTGSAKQAASGSPARGPCAVVAAAVTFCTDSASPVGWLLASAR